MTTAPQATTTTWSAVATTDAARPARLRSLDALRGIAVAAMILVNNPGDASHIHPALRHAEWNGIAAADFIFPFFLFVVGVATALSAGRPLGLSLWRRTALLLALGLFLNGFPLFDWSELRLPGVLQRIALCSLLATLAAAWLQPRGLAILWATLVVGHWMVLLLAQAGDAFSPEGNVAALIDDRLFGSHHLLHPHSDPEGLLGTLPALATTLTGVLAGRWLRSSRAVRLKLAGLTVAGGLGVLLALSLEGFCPINKSLWTSTYVLLTGGAALVVLAGCHWLIDVRGRQAWALPFVAYGSNPIAMYVLSSLIAKEMLLWRVDAPTAADLHERVFEAAFLPLASADGASALYALAYVAVWLGIAVFLYRRGVFIKV